MHQKITLSALILVVLALPACTSFWQYGAPGSDSLQVNSTAIESLEAVRSGRTESFSAAVGDMTGNLLGELNSFEQQLEQNPELVQLSWADSGSGGGAGSFGVLLVLLMSAAARRGRSAK